MVLRRGNRRETSFSFRLTEAPISRFTVTGLQSHTLSLFRNGTSTRPAHGHSIILPFFAYFERFLSIFARLVDLRIVDLKSGLNCSAESVIYFQRITVIISDLCLLYGVDRLTKRLEPIKQNLICAYGPFIYHGQIQQVISRMFPFGRGLCHAYWAPNFWAFYIIIDKGLSFFLRRLGFDIQIPSASFTGGLVGDSSPFEILPQITPLTTFAIVLLAVTPCLQKAWQKPHPGLVARWIAYAYTCGFLFGWHVHENASLHFTIPLAIVAVQSLEDAKHYFLVSIVSCYSLFPLLYESQEYLIKVLLLLLHSMVMWLGFAAQYTDDKTQKKESGESRARLGLDVLRRAI